MQGGVHHQGVHLLHLGTGAGCTAPYCSARVQLTALMCRVMHLTAMYAAVQGTACTWHVVPVGCTTVLHLARSASGCTVSANSTFSADIINTTVISDNNTNSSVFHTITSNNSENSMFCVLFLLKSVVKIEIMVNLKFIF